MTERKVWKYPKRCKKMRYSEAKAVMKLGITISSLWHPSLRTVTSERQRKIAKSLVGTCTEQGERIRRSKTKLKIVKGRFT